MVNSWRCPHIYACVQEKVFELQEKVFELRHALDDNKISESGFVHLLFGSVQGFILDTISTLAFSTLADEDVEDSDDEDLDFSNE